MNEKEKHYASGRGCGKTSMIQDWYERKFKALLEIQSIAEKIALGVYKGDGEMVEFRVEKSK